MAFGKDMQNGAKAGRRNTYLIIGIALLLVGLWGYGHFTSQQFNTIATPTGGNNNGGNTVSTTATSCTPSTSGLTTVNIALRNSLNGSTQYMAETFDIFQNGNFIKSVTTNNGSAINYASTSLVSGQTYKFYGVSDTTANAKLMSASGTNGVALSPDNSFITVKTQCASAYVNLVGTAHANSLDVRMYNQDTTGWFYSNTTQANTAWIQIGNSATNSSDNATFMSITNSNTTQTVGANGEVNMVLHLRATNNYENMNDFGYLVLVDAGTKALTQWNTFSITVNGKIYNSDTTSLTSAEQKAFSGNDWAFIINQPLTKTPSTTIHVDMTATSIVPTSNIIITIVPRAQFLNQDNNGMNIGAAKDDTTFSIPVDSFTVVKAIN